MSAEHSIAERIRAITAADTDDFVELARIADRDPARHFRYLNLSGIDFSGMVLDGFNFTGANMEGCRFDGARIVGARFDVAQVDGTALRQAEDWGEYLRSWQRPAGPISGRHLPYGAVFSDAPFAPEMVVIPPGTFLMGSPDSGPDAYDDEKPQHKVTIGYRFAIGRYPVTFEEFDAFCEATGRKKPGNEGWGRGRRPVINVSWDDAEAYLNWLAGETGKPYRLPSEAEWEYACRAGTETQHWWGDDFDPAMVNVGGEKTSEVGAYPANPWGVHDTNGNVWEWVEDTWHSNYDGAPADGSAWPGGDESFRVFRGGSWNYGPRNVRSANRSRVDSILRFYSSGFRVARTL